MKEVKTLLPHTKCETMFGTLDVFTAGTGPQDKVVILRGDWACLSHSDLIHAIISVAQSSRWYIISGAGDTTKE